jgi:hypothetical protein
MQALGESWDVVEIVRLLVTEVDSLQKIVAGQEARLQVLESPAAPRPLIQVGELVAESTEPAPGRRVKGEATVGATDRKA